MVVSLFHRCHFKIHDELSDIFASGHDDTRTSSCIGRLTSENNLPRTFKSMVYFLALGWKLHLYILLHSMKSNLICLMAMLMYFRVQTPAKSHIIII